jgi:hypothetical protein
MGQISEVDKKSVHVVFKYLSKSLLLLTPTLFPGLSVDISFKDDVTVIFLLGVSFMIYVWCTVSIASMSLELHYFPETNTSVMATFLFSLLVLLLSV